MMKNQATQTMRSRQRGRQIFGGAGLSADQGRGIYREVKVNAIGGGTEGIRKDLASREMDCEGVRLIPSSRRARADGSRLR